MWTSNKQKDCLFIKKGKEVKLTGRYILGLWTIVSIKDDSNYNINWKDDENKNTVVTIIFI